jgi:hypothetical protein
MDEATSKKIGDAIRLLEQVAEVINDPEEIGEILADVEERVFLKLFS